MKIINIFSSIKNFIINKISKLTDDIDKNSVEYWQQIIFYSIYIAASIIVIAAYISSLSYAISKGNFLSIIIISFFFIFYILILFIKKFSFKIKVLLGCILPYILGIFMMILYGPAGDARIWFFAFILLTSLFTNLKLSVSASILVFFTDFLFGYLNHLELINWNSFNKESLIEWLIVSINFYIVSTIFAVAISIFLWGVKKSFKKVEVANKKINQLNLNLEKKVIMRTKKLEKAKKLIEDNNIKLQKLNSLKNDFIANITHDFRSPLTVILNMADLGIKKISDEDNYELIYQAGLKLKTSIDRLLDLARIDGIGIKFNIQKTNIVNFIDKLASFYVSSCFANQIKIKKILPDKEITNFYTDPEKLEEVISNVISNSIKFVEIGKGVIEIKIENKAKEIIISIKDNGIGIEKKYLNSIFERFSQVEGGRNSLYQGTGIGLAFSKQIIEALKGEIWAESEGLEKGATFFIKLKKGKKIFKEEKIKEEEYTYIYSENKKITLDSIIKNKTPSQKVIIELNEVNKEYEYDYKKGKILIVEDDKTIIKIIREYLLINGYNNFILASNGKQALDVIYDHHPDIIISDYNMPEMNGDEFYNNLLSNPNFKNIPFIFLSAILHKDLIREQRQKGACAYLKKPIDENDLILTVEYHLKQYFEYLKAIDLSNIDELTGLQNRRALLQNFNHELLSRNLKNISLIFFDVDFFKRYNDKYGHQFGDEILKSIGQIIKDTLRKYDIPGRYGGDEFLIALPDTASDQALKAAENLKNKIFKNILKIKNKKIKITCSFGISSLYDNELYICKILGIKNLKDIYQIKNKEKTNWKNIEDIKMQISPLLIKLADKAMYSAKSTICKECSYQSEKEEQFKNNKCPKCKTKNIIKGRNKIFIIKE